MLEPRVKDVGAPRPARRLVVGLTGGIGSGKTAVADMLAARGAAVLDADAIAHELTAPGGGAIAPILAAFGPSMITPDGAMDRPRMRAAVFADPALRRRLESILHPRIGEALHARAAIIPGPYLVLVIPLLIEGLERWRDRVDRIAVVECPESEQIHRVMARSGLSETQARAIIATQASREQRRRVADDLIDNTGSLEDLRARVASLHQQYCSVQLAESPKSAC